MIPRSYQQASPAPLDACTRIGALWWERVPNCSRMNPAWIRKQSIRNWHGPYHTPRKHAVYQWCQLPALDGDWDLHWLGRKGTGPYRCPNACTPLRPLRMPHDPSALIDPPEAWAQWWRSVQAVSVFCFGDWLDVSPETTCADTPPRPTRP